MTKKSSFLLLVLIPLFTFVSCGEGKAENVVQDYICYLQNQDYDNAYSLISNRDKEVTTYDDFVTYYKNGNDLSTSFIIHLFYFKNSTFKDITAVKRDKNNYEVNVLYNCPIFTDEFTSTITNDIESLKLSCNTIEGILELLDTEYENISFETEENLYSYDVIKENSKYKIFIDII